MKPWKTVLGVGAACAACCAVPLIGGAAVLTAGTAALATMGSALLACAQDLAPLGAVLLVLAAGGIGVMLWRRRARLAAPTPSGCQGSCKLPTT